MSADELKEYEDEEPPCALERVSLHIRTRFKSSGEGHSKERDWETTRFEKKIICKQPRRETPPSSSLVLLERKQQISNFQACPPASASMSRKIRKRKLKEIETATVSLGSEKKLRKVSPGLNDCNKNSFVSKATKRKLSFDNKATDLEPLSKQKKICKLFWSFFNLF